MKIYYISNKHTQQLFPFKNMYLYSLSSLPYISTFANSSLLNRDPSVKIILLSSLTLGVVAACMSSVSISTKEEKMKKSIEKHNLYKNYENMLDEKSRCTNADYNKF